LLIDPGHGNKLGRSGRTKVFLLLFLQKKKIPRGTNARPQGGEGILASTRGNG